MNIILVSNNMSKVRTLSLGQCLLVLAAILIVPPLITAALILPQPDKTHQGARELLPLRLINNLIDPRNDLNALALQIGQIQARMMRLDALSDRLAAAAGIQDKKVPASSSSGQGGPMVLGREPSAVQMKQQVEQLLLDMQARSDRLEALEALLLQQNLRKNTHPSGQPLAGGYNSSGYGWRLDPFTGQTAFHEGLDYQAEVGTPILAAADGIVTQAERTPDYGNIVKIDHGGGLETRYAHASRLLVKAGERVTRGQLVAEVGNTGRSTGAHLHFEVRLNGAPLDPRKYLNKSNG